MPRKSEKPTARRARARPVVKAKARTVPQGKRSSPADPVEAEWARKLADPRSNVALLRRGRNT